MSTSTPNITEVRPSSVKHSSKEASMHAVVLNVFESEDAARSAVGEAQPPGDLIAFDSVEIGEIGANA